MCVCVLGKHETMELSRCWTGSGKKKRTEFSGMKRKRVTQELDALNEWEQRGRQMN